MLRDDPLYFDIDVDLAPVFGTDESLLVSDRWYHLLQSNHNREPQTQLELEDTFSAELFRLECEAHSRQLDRRRSWRAPIISGVNVDPGTHFIATNVSTMGLCCSGRPRSGMLDIEFKLPGLAFPVAARAEVASYVDRPVIPLMGLRFVDIELPYIEHINRYIDTKRQHRNLV
ncbi:MAG: PilZ domain-containing protein [Deltaproteobacteria bacterium]|nr:PilZ domain-containing protein [Deltaproteobacteria bacterium]